MNRGMLNNQIDKITCLYYDFLSTWPSLDMGQVSRWINGKQVLSPAIAEHYAVSSHRQDFPSEIRRYLIPVLIDPGAAAKDLYDLIIQDDSLSWEKRDSLTRHYKHQEQGWLERFLADILYFVACRPSVPLKGKTIRLASGPPSPDVSERIRGAGVPLPVRHFSGREDDLRDLHEMILTDTVVFIQGLAGIGKSELSRQYARIHKKEYTNLLYLVYSGDLRKDIADLPFTEDLPEDSLAVRLERHHRYLKSLKGDTLLIIDNFDVLEEDEPFFSEILKYSCRILLTTRFLWEDYPTLVLNELDNNRELYAMITTLYPSGSNDPEGMKTLAEAVQRHTFALELCCRLLARGVFSVDELLGQLKKSTAVPDNSDKIRIRKDGCVRKQTYYEHISMLFSLFRLNKEHRIMLGNVSMIPMKGIDRIVFCHLMKLINANDLNDLIDMGLVHQTGDDRIGLHPLIRELIYKEIRPDDRTCESLCEGIREQCLRFAEDVEWRYEMMEMIITMADHMGVNRTDYSLRFLQDAWTCLQKYNNTEGMRIVISKIEDLLDNSRDYQSKDLALYYDYRAAMSEDPRERLHWEKEALKALPNDPKATPLALNVLNNLVVAYYTNGRIRESLKYSSILMGLYEKNPTYRGHDYVAFLLNYGMVRLNNGQYREALGLFETLRKTYVEEGLTESQDYAEILERIGLIYLITGKSNLGRKYMEEGCRIYSRTCIENPEEAKAHNTEVTTLLKMLKRQRLPKL